MISNIKDIKFMKKLALIVLGILLIFSLLLCVRRDTTDKNAKGETPNYEVEDTEIELSTEENETDTTEQTDAKNELPLDESDTVITEQSGTQTEQPQDKQENDVPEQDEEDTQSPSIGTIEMPFVPAK